MDNPIFLVVDDDEDDRAILAEVSRESGYSCQLLFAQDGQQALELLESTPDKPCLVLLDINMPRMNGFELLQALKTSARWRSLPILILTTSSSEDTVRKAYQSGANSYIIKPSGYESIARMWENLYQLWVQVAVLPNGDFYACPSNS